MTVVVRRIRPVEGAALRSLRLSALADSPSAFASTLAAESELPPSHWDEMAATRSIGDERATFVAVGGDEWLGMVGAYHSAAEQGTVELVAMFTAPAGRGRGVGAGLVDAVITWAGETGGRRVALWVVRENAVARRLYERAGFAEVEPDAAAAVGASAACAEEARMSLTL